MAKWKQAGVIAAVGVMAFVVGRAMPVSGGAVAAQPEKKAAQPDKKPAQPEKKGDAKPGDMPPGMAEMMAMMQPGENHKLLDPMVGDFEGGVKFWMAPGTDPMESKGSVHREWVLDGRYVCEHVDATSMGMAFKGLGYVGYNTVEKKYESIWLENMSTNMQSATGSYDAAKKTFTFIGEVLDPQTGKKTLQTTTIDISNPDREVMLGSSPGPDGKPFKNFEGVFERKKK